MESLFHKISNKVFSLYILLRYGKMPASIRYYYRDTYYCRLLQIKYFIKDYITRPQYKTVSFSGEFAPDLTFALPFAYWHYKNGTLLKTEAAKYTKELYFFSENHEEAYETRITEGNYNFETPRILYSHNYNMKKWEQVPLKEIYKNDIYLFDKPILIIANRYNMEWDGPPISFFSIEVLDFIINNLKDKYTIIYNRPRPQNISMDNSDIYNLDEYNWIEETHPEVILMENLFKENRAQAKSFNHLQLLVYANSENFVSTHGGTSALASYFGGKNIILSKKGPEHHFKCYNKLYPKLSGAEIYHAKTDEELKTLVINHYKKLH